MTHHTLYFTLPCLCHDQKDFDLFLVFSSVLILLTVISSVPIFPCIIVRYIVQTASVNINL
uniref:Uncharacterized protein n=1 Tax=Xiphophorus maculatus TaxID=8083 RepID=A0A3B5PT64_XIPMA